jgi:hypothetical protein
MTLSTIQVLAEATAVLEAGGYRTTDPPESWPASARVFEDPYGIVALHVYDTWEQLETDWTDAQGLLVDLISSHVRKAEPKAWEGYLVLFTVGQVVEANNQVLVDLRYDTNRVRKLVAAAEDLESLTDVRTALLALLPLHIDESTSPGDRLLGHLPELLAEEGIDRDVTEVAIDAFAHNQSVMQRLYELGHLQ